MTGREFDIVDVSVFCDMASLMDDKRWQESQQQQVTSGHQIPRQSHVV